MDGFLVVDKPVGLSSHDVVSRIRRLAGTKKVGHTGTLDPFAIGVLPVAIGEGTKAIQFLDESVKEYRATLLLGSETDTYDATGTAVARAAVPALGLDDLLKILDGFKGTIQQIPPMYSAIKQGGKPLYRLARQGVTVERKPRTVTVHALDVLKFDLPEIEISVSCSPGTYIRSLAFDVGRAIGCGAHLTALQRTRSGCFELGGAYTLDALKGRVERGEGLPLVSLRQALSHLPWVEADEVLARKIGNGIRPSLADLPEGMNLCAGATVLFGYAGELLAAACVPEEGKGGQTLRLLRVFCQDSPLHSATAMVEPQN